MCFGARLRYLRKNKNLTQKQLADCIGVTRQAIAAYEISIREPNFEILMKIANYFKVSMDFIFGRVDSAEFDAYVIAMNIRLIRGEQSYIDFSKKIGNKLAVTITPEKLELYEKAKVKPDISEIGLLSKYADVSTNFFHTYGNLRNKV